MNWNEIHKDLDPGEYIVKTKTMFNWNVLRVKLSYDKEHKQIWSCKNQVVTHYLN